MYFTTGTGHSLFAWLTPLLYKFSKLHGNLISVCLVSSLPCPKPRGIFVMISSLPVLLVPHIFFYSFALSFFYSIWSGGEVPLSTAIEVTEAVLTPGLLLFKPIQTKHILRGHDIRGGLSFSFPLFLCLSLSILQISCLQKAFS